MYLTKEICAALQKELIPVCRLDTGDTGSVIGLSGGNPVFAQILRSGDTGIVLDAKTLKIMELPADGRRSRLRNELNPYKGPSENPDGASNACLWNQGFDECLLELDSPITDGPYVEGFEMGQRLRRNLGLSPGSSPGSELSQ